MEALPALIFGQPIRYAFEGLISNEFHTLNGTCSFLIPSGPGYENVSLTNQVCGTVGSIPGQSTVDGNRYIALMFDYSYSHIWLVSDMTPRTSMSVTDIGVELRHHYRVWHGTFHSTINFHRVQHAIVWRDKYRTLQAKDEGSGCARS